MPKVVVYYLHNAFPMVSNMLYSYSSKTFLVVSFAFISFFSIYLIGEPIKNGFETFLVYLFSAVFQIFNFQTFQKFQK